jgi:purine-binding chemotaxis protein CheW
MTQPLQVLTARVGEQWVALAVDAIIEVLPMLACSEAHSSRHEVLGLVIVRDEVMPLIDLRRVFGAAQAAVRLDTPLIAVRAGGGACALLVDEADRVVEVRRGPGRQVNAGQHPAICDVLRHDDRVLLLLDPGQIAAG